MKTRIPLSLICVSLFTPLLSAQTKASADTTNVVTIGPRDQLQQFTTQLQNSPNDRALREKIIALALTLNPKPATPDAAIMAEGGAEYAFKNAKTNSDYSDAAKEYEKALLLAPWLAADYFNCGVAHEKAGENKEAIRNFNLYLRAAPNADDAVVVKKRIGGVEYAAQKVDDAAKEQARVANEQARVAAQQAKVYEGLDGGVWALYGINRDSDRPLMSGSVHDREFIEVHGRQIEMYSVDDINGRMTDTWNVSFTGRQFRITKPDGASSDVTISDDGKSIILDLEYLYRGAPHRDRWYFHRTK